MNGTEVRTGTLRVGVAADHELLTPLTLDLAPLGVSPPAVWTVRPLRDHALEARLAGRAEEALAVSLEVVGVAQRIDRRDELTEARLAVAEPEPAEVSPPEREAVVEVRDDRHGRDGSARVHPALEELEARPPLLVKRHDLPVEHEILTRQAVDRGGDLGILARHVEAVPRAESGATVRAQREHADAVQLQLEHPVRALGDLVHEHRQHEGKRRKREPRARKPARLRPRRMCLRPAHCPHGSMGTAARV